MGQIYVAPVARVTDNDTGIGGSGGSTAGGGYWILWTTAGYTGNGWYWDSELYPNNYLMQGWADAVMNGHGFVDNCTGEDGSAHKATYESFKYHVDNGHVDNLDTVLGGWSNQSKNEFINHDTDLYNSACITWR